MIKPKPSIDNLFFEDILETESNWRLKLDKNENPYGCSDYVINTLRLINRKEISNFSGENIYKEKISSFFNVRYDNIFFANDSNDALKLILDVYLDKNEKLLSLSFLSNQLLIYSNLSGANAELFEFNDFRFDFDEIKNYLNQNKDIKILYLTNPDFETGSVVSPYEIELLAKINSKTLFIVDLSYILFAQNVDIQDYFNLVREIENIVFIKSFSYDYALAGFKTAIIIANSNVIFNIKKLRSTNCVNAASLHCLYNALNDNKHIDEVINKNALARKFFVQEFEKMQYKIYPSGGNFVLCDFGVHCEFYFNKLKKNGVIVKKYPKNSPLSNHLRITIPKISGVRYLLEIFKKQELLIFSLDDVIFEDGEKLLIPYEILKNLSKTYTLAISTTKNSIDSNFALYKTGVEKFFTSIVTYDDVRMENINPLQKTLSSCPYLNRPKLLSSQVVDIINAKNSNIETIAIISKNDDSALALNNFKHSGADEILKNKEEFDNYIKTLVKPDIESP